MNSGTVGAALVEQGLDVDDSTIVTQEAPANEPDDVASFRARATRVEEIPITLIQKSEVALRGAQTNTERFQLLLNSIRKRGVLNSILVCERKGPHGQVTYGLIDGLQRLTAATTAGLTHIPAKVVDMDESEILEAQIITNLNRIETKPAELSKHLLRMLARNPFMTKQQLAERTCQSLKWVEERLSLDNLLPDIQKLVDSGKIHLSNAYALSKIPQEEQTQHVDSAISESIKTFVPRMKARVKEIREAKKAGRDASPVTFQPQQYMQKVGDVKAELNDNDLAVGRQLIEKYGVSTPLDAWKLCINWMLHFDSDSQTQQKLDYEAREKKKAEEKERKKKEAEARKQQAAAEAAASLEKW